MPDISVEALRRMANEHEQILALAEVVRALKEARKLISDETNRELIQEIKMLTAEVRKLRVDMEETRYTTLPVMSRGA